MSSSGKDRIETLSEEIARLLKRQEEMEQRVARLEEELNARKVIARPENLNARLANAADKTLPERKPLTRTPSSESSPPPASRALETSFGLTWVNRIGVVTLVLAVAFFFKYAVDNQWIGDTGRVVIGSLIGVVLLGIAEYLSRTGEEVYAQGLCGAGIAILYLSLYAAFDFYQILPWGIAFLFMALTTALAGALAVRYKASAIAILGLLGGYATPLLLGKAENHPWPFFAYISVLNIGALMFARSGRKWRLLESLAVIATAFLFVSWFISSFRPEERSIATFFALIYYMLFSTANVPIVLVASQLLSVLAMAAIWSGQVTYLPFALSLSVAGAVLADVRRRPALAAAAFGGFWTFYALWHIGLSESYRIGPILLALTVAFLVFLGRIPWLILVRKVGIPARELILLALNGVIYFGMCYSLLRDGYSTYLGAFAGGVGGLHLILGRWLQRCQAGATRDPRPVLLSQTVGLGFLILAVPIQLSGYRITMAWAVEGAAFVWIALRASSRRLLHLALAVFLFTLLRIFFMESRMYSEPATYSAFLNLRFLCFLVVTVSLWAAANWLRYSWPALATYVAGHIVILSALVLEVSGCVARNVANQNLSSVKSVSVSILVAAYALVMVGIGVLSRSWVNRIFGLALIGFVVLKLYFHDVWLLSRLYRVVGFTVLGILLLLISYLYSRYRNSVESLWKGKT